jgi:hypothetical protein
VILILFPLALVYVVASMLLTAYWQLFDDIAEAAMISMMDGEQ